MIADGTRHIERERPRTRWTMLVWLWFAGTCITAAVQAWMGESVRELLRYESGAFSCRTLDYSEPSGATQVCVMAGVSLPWNPKARTTRDATWWHAAP